MPCPYEEQPCRSFRAKETGIGVHVFVAAAGEIEDDEIIAGQARRALDKVGKGVGGFERGDDAFDARQGARGGDRGVIAHGRVFGAMLVG